MDGRRPTTSANYRAATEVPIAEFESAVEGRVGATESLQAPTHCSPRAKAMAGRRAVLQDISIPWHIDGGTFRPIVLEGAYQFMFKGSCRLRHHGYTSENTWLILGGGKTQQFRLSDAANLMLCGAMRRHPWWRFYRRAQTSAISYAPTIVPLQNRCPAMPTPLPPIRLVRRRPRSERGGPEHGREHRAVDITGIPP